VSTSPDTVLASASYRGDIDHFRLLRRSLKRFGLGDIPHHVVVHTEDRDLFLPLVDGGMKLHTTADVLPPQIEANRLRAAAVRRRLGRRAAVWLMSLESA